MGNLFGKKFKKKKTGVENTSSSSHGEYTKTTAKIPTLDHSERSKKGKERVASSAIAGVTTAAPTVLRFDSVVESSLKAFDDIRILPVDMSLYCKPIDVDHLRRHFRGGKERKIPVVPFVRNCGLVEKTQTVKLLKDKCRIVVKHLQGVVSVNVENPYLLSPMQLALLEEHGWVDETTGQETKRTTTAMARPNKYVVFRDLWRKGYYLRTGSKFGGDFLAYNGDPETTHAPFVIYVVPAGSAFEGSDFVRQGRMFTATQKRTVIAVVNKGGAGVNYFELATG